MDDNLPELPGRRQRRREADGEARTPRRPPARRANALGGKHWLRNSISVWSDIQKSRDEGRLGHPAMFPAMLVTRLIESFLPPQAEIVLDPFAGSGSTVAAAAMLGRTGIGLELSAEYVALARSRLAQLDGPAAARSVVHHASAETLPGLVSAGSVDLCITSPPYWNILNRRRSADGKEIRHYGNHDGDLGTVADYGEYLERLAGVFRNVLTALRPGAYCCVVVMDLRRKDRFFPLHSDLAARLQEVGYVWDDLIVWNRQSEYNHLRPLGYPSVFRVNKVHEFVLILQKPRESHQSP